MNTSSDPPPESNQIRSVAATEYWNKSLVVVVGVLSVWALLSLGGGVLFREALDQALPPIGGAPFGFWIAQQGAIIGFVLLLVIYMFLMNSLDRRYGYSDEEIE